jgi:hypothetical protein
MFVRRSLVLVLFAVILVLGCNSSESADAAGEEDKPKPQESSWQLADDSAFTATITPWPAQQGQNATIRGAASTDDGDQKFSGTVHYRILEREDGYASWQPMTQTSASSADLAEFEAQTTLPGTDRVWMQFKLQQQSQSTPEELKDWAVELED